jgi:hypothetical protein
MMRRQAATDQDEVRALINNFLVMFFDAYPIGSVDPDDILAPEALMSEIADWAQLLISGRAEVRYEKIGTNWTPVAAMPPEGPWRVADYLKELAFGHCLIHGRSEISKADLRIVGHAAVSSIPRHLRPIVRELARTGVADTRAVMRLCGVTHPTARNYLSEVALLGIGVLTKGDPVTNQPNSISLTKYFYWLRRTLKYTHLVSSVRG